MTSVFATTLPEHSNDGYVAAAYIVFFAIVLVYVAIMAVRLTRVERKAMYEEAYENGRQIAGMLLEGLRHRKAV